MITLATVPLTTTYLIAIRLGTIFILSPIEAVRALPIHARILLVLILSMLMMGHVPLSNTLPQNHLTLIAASLAEFCNGLILSASLFAAFAVFQLAGQLIDTQIGLNTLAILNPTDHSHEPLNARLLTLLAVMNFFAVGGHIKLTQALAMSFILITPGQLALFNGFTPMMYQCGLMFSLAIMIASPIIISLVIIDMASALLTRNMPQISTYFLTLPIKIITGLLLTQCLLTYINPAINYVFTVFFQTWVDTLQ